MLKFLTLPSLLLMLINPISGQVSDVEDFQSPLNIPLFLSGNFGELRSTHFHAGLDFKTQGVTGHPVYASSDGYVSRIKVQSGGYGQSIYISHPNGYTTLYAHLDKYLPEIRDYVEHYQYSKQSYEVDIYVPENKFVFSKGDLIAYSGNTGRSGGPHLHFEIRKTAGQIPVNGLKYGFSVQDNIPPEFRSVYTYAYRNQEPNAIQLTRNRVNTVQKMNDSVYSIKNEIIVDGAYLGFGTEIYDFLNGSNNKCGVYTLQLLIDDLPVFGFTIDEISFAKTRFINAHMDYDLKINKRKSVHRLFVLPNNELPIYTGMGSKGIFALRDFETHHGKILAEDVYGNKSILIFKFRRREDVLFDVSIPEINYLVEWHKGRQFKKEGLSIDIPSGALYQDINFTYDLIKGNAGFLSDTFLIHNPKEPLHKAITISAKIGLLPAGLTDKLVFAQINEDGKVSSSGGEFSQGILMLKTRKFGKYIILADSIAPEIKFMGLDEKGLVFTISDELSGIKNYTGYIDDDWALFSYDSKSGTLRYEIDTERIIDGAEHTLELIVLDNKGNKSIYTEKIIF